MYWRIRNTPNAVTSSGAITAWRRFIQPQVLHLDVQRDHAELHRDEHRRDDVSISTLLAAELDLCEREPGQRAEHDDGERDRRCDDRRVHQRGPEVDVDLARVEDPRDVVPELAGPASATGG